MEELMLTTYIGFEFEGVELAERFSSLTNEQQNEARLLVEELLNDYWTEVGSPKVQNVLAEPDVEDAPASASDDKMMCQVDAEANAEYYPGCGFRGCGYGGGCGGCGYGGGCCYGGNGFGAGCGYGAGCGCGCTTYYRRALPGSRRILETNIVHENIHDVHHHHNFIERHNVHIKKYCVPGCNTCQDCTAPYC